MKGSSPIGSNIDTAPPITVQQASLSSKVLSWARKQSQVLTWMLMTNDLEFRKAQFQSSNINCSSRRMSSSLSSCNMASIRDLTNHQDILAWANETKTLIVRSDPNLKKSESIPSHTICDLTSKADPLLSLFVFRCVSDPLLPGHADLRHPTLPARGLGRPVPWRGRDVRHWPALPHLQGKERNHQSSQKTPIK